MMNTSEFSSLHPAVNLLYFLFVFLFCCTGMHPLMLAASFFSSVCFLLVLRGRKALSGFVLLIPAMVLTSLVNPLFNHEGATILAYLPDGNPLTAESLIYGICSAFSLVSVICFFSCFGAVMTSDKLMYLFGRIVPSLSLVLSMTLRFVPLFISRLKKTADAQKCIGKGLDEGSLLQKINNALRILSSTVTWALENAADTADSMRSRGYGSGKRTAYSNFRFEKRDITALLYILILGIYVLIGKITGNTKFVFYPVIKYDGLSAYALSVFACCLLLFTAPLTIEFWEVIRWKYIRSKI